MLPKTKILVVDHDPAALRQIELLLRVMGAVPRCLASATQAAELINKEKFDGVFLEWKLSELDGRQLTQRIRKSRSNSKVPIALLTERHFARAVAEGFQSGVTFSLSKPVGPTELRRLLDASRAAMLEERRRYQRAPLAVPVVCDWGEGHAAGRAINISASGLLMQLKPCPESGSPVSVEFTLPQPRQRLQLEALVARTAANKQVGIKFVGVSRTHCEMLKVYTDCTLGVHPVF